MENPTLPTYNCSTRVNKLAQFLDSDLLRTNSDAQLRSSFPRFLSPVRFVRIENPATYLFSISRDIPIPPASTF